MTHHATNRARATRRRGAAYVLILSTGVLLSVVGLGILTASRHTSQTASHTANLAEAAALAESAVSWGLAAVKADANWRTTYTNNVETTPRTMGRGTISFKLVDEADGNLSNNTSDAVRLYGIGRCGSATRAYSVELAGAGGSSLDSLKNPVQAGANLTVSSGLTVTGGPISANGTLNIPSGITVTGDVEAVSLNISGSVTGTKTTLSAARTLPQSSVFDTYKSQATEIAFSNISSGIVNNRVISSASNPWGATNGQGVYYIRVPSTGTLTIKSSRLVATLVVELEGGGKLTTSGAVAWDPPRTDYPTLIVKATSGCTVSLGGSSSALSEGLTLTNFNPAGTPNSAGVADTDKTDSYPAEFHGLIHVIGSGFTTSLNNYFNLKGTLIAEAAVTTATGVKLAADPVLVSNPPAGYTAASEVAFSPGTWKWSVTP